MRPTARKIIIGEIMTGIGLTHHVHPQQQKYKIHPVLGRWRWCVESARWVPSDNWELHQPPGITRITSAVYRRWTLLEW